MKTLLAVAAGATVGFLMGSKAGHRPYETVHELAARRIAPLLDRSVDVRATGASDVDEALARFNDDGARQTSVLA